MSRWARSRSDVHAGFLRGVVWVYAGTAEPGWFVISSSGKGDSDESAMPPPRSPSPGVKVGDKAEKTEKILLMMVDLTPTHTPASKQRVLL